jgi:signal peptidase II
VELRRALPWFAVAAAIVLADRVTKLLVLGSFAPGERLQVTPFFNMVLVFNKGAAFSFLAGASGWQTPVFATISTVAAIVLSRPDPAPYGRTGCSAPPWRLILGGALGNLWDRLLWGHVVDFLDFHAAGWHWPAFNVADSAITIGAGLLILESFARRDGGG